MRRSNAIPNWLAPGRTARTRWRGNRLRRLRLTITLAFIEKGATAGEKKGRLQERKRAAPLPRLRTGEPANQPGGQSPGDYSGRIELSGIGIANGCKSVEVALTVSSPALLST